MIFFDVTKSDASGHRSGLMRVSTRLRKELGAAVTPVSWPKWDRVAARDDWFVTAELFSEAERPGLWAFVRNPPCRLAAIFHDAIPLKLPQVTWPQSVARQAEYMKMLARFDRVLAVSEASRRDLEGFWRWQGANPRARVGTIPLGADFDGTARAAGRAGPAAGPFRFLCVGIIEPRKNQAFLLDICTDLWREGQEFELHLSGRINPHFGRPIAEKIKAMEGAFSGLHFHGAVDDRTLAELYARADASVFPTLAEGCGLPLLESLWHGVPCLCSDLPALRENAAGGGCQLAAANDAEAWKTALRLVLTDAEARRKLRDEAIKRPLPRWSETAAALRLALTD